MNDQEVSRLKNRIRRLRLAQADMEQTAAAAAFLAVNPGQGALDRALETAVVICYSRPFAASNRVGALSRDEWAPTNVELRKLHYTLFDLRDSVYAHNDKTLERGVQELAHLFGPAYDDHYAEAFQPAPPSLWPQVEELAREMQERAEAEAAACEELLRGAGPRPQDT